MSHGYKCENIYNKLNFPKLSEERKRNRVTICQCLLQTKDILFLNNHH